MQGLALREVLDRQHLGAVDLAEQQDTGVDRLIGERAVAQAREDDGAGAAVAFAAAFLGALGASLFAQPIEQRGAWRKAVKRDRLAADAEGQTPACLHPQRSRSPPSSPSLSPGAMMSLFARKRKRRYRNATSAFRKFLKD